MSIVLKTDGDSALQAGNANADAYVQGRGDTDFVVFRKADLAASEAFVLIDLSDSANFPHTETGRIRLYSLAVTTEIQSDGQYIVYFGVVTEVDATDGSTKWIAALDLETVINPTDSTDRRNVLYHWPNGLDLEISGGALVKGLSNSGDSADADWQTDVALDSPLGDGLSAPGAGDLVMLVSETGGTGTLSITVTAEYITEAASS